VASDTTTKGDSQTMIPRCVKAWLLLYGFFFGATIGATFGILGNSIGLLWILMLVLIFASLVLMMVIDWKYSKTLEKWLPYLNKSIFDLLRKKKET